MNDLLFITFDQKKDEYPTIPYSIAVLMAALKNKNFKVGHISFDIQHALADVYDLRMAYDEDKFHRPLIDEISNLGYEIESKWATNVKTNSAPGLTKIIRQRLYENIEYFKRFKFLAVSLTSWTIEHCQSLFNMLTDYGGKIILGGYEVTSMSEEMLFSMFPKADFFIKGYAEKALINLISNADYYPSRVINDLIENENLVSPYLTGILNTTTRKIHWETKRGCPFHCGFCEWGNSLKNVFEIDKSRLFQEIEIFRQSSIEEINILDGTFNYGKNYLEIFRELLGINGLKITCQARFENLLNKDGLEFLKICAENKGRVHLEFGLQTIFESEMKVIGRINDLKKVEQALDLLNKNEIDFETSIIYAIPGQTVHSFIDTIEFLITKGCKNIKAYQLCIPKNSKMYHSKDELLVSEGKNSFNVTSVISSNSFSLEELEDMKRIAYRLNNGLIKYGEKNKSRKSFKTIQASAYQYDVISVSKRALNNEIVNEIFEGFIIPTVNYFRKVSSSNYLLVLGGGLKSGASNKSKLFEEIISGKYSFKLQKSWIAETGLFPSTAPNPFDNCEQDIQIQRFSCCLRLSMSNNFYIIRKISFQQIEM